MIFKEECFSILRNNINFIKTEAPSKCIMITSANDGEGKTTLASNLAISFAKGGKRTLLIDGNIYNPILHTMFNLKNDFGLLSIFKNKRATMDCIKTTQFENLNLLTAGLYMEDYMEILMNDKLDEAFNYIRKNYEIIIVDTPSMKHLSCVQVLSQYTDGCILTLREGFTDIKDAIKTKDLLFKLNANILGTVLNKNIESREMNDTVLKLNKLKTIKPINKGGLNLIKKKFINTTIAATIILSLLIPAKIGFAIDHTQEQDLSISTLKPEKNNSNAVQITTNLDSVFILHNLLHNPFTMPNSPVTAIVKEPITIGIKGYDLCKKYSVKILGDNSYNKEAKDLILFYNWTPDTVGIFKIVVYKDNNQVTERKVYVNSSNKIYPQITDLMIRPDKNNNTHVSVSTENSKVNKALTKFVVSEPCVWSRTIKNYNSSEEVSEKSGKFKFNSGTYKIDAFIKGKNSIEYEDAYSKYYRKSGLNGLTLSIESKKTDEGEYAFTATVSGVNDSNLLYAFLLWDEKGTHLVKGYDDPINTFNFTPPGPGKYIVYARVKQAGKIDNLPNSYEAEAAYPITIPGTNPKITIHSIKIDAYEANKALENIKLDTFYRHYSISDGYAVSHEMNYIAVNVLPKCISGIQYRAYVIHDGYSYFLNEYSSSNIIPFYPKSSGEYKLVILAKDSNSGSEDAQLKKTINVLDITNIPKSEIHLE